MAKKEKEKMFEPYQIRMTEWRVPLRAEPKAKGEVLEYLAQGAVVTVTDASESFLKVVYRDFRHEAEGFIAEGAGTPY